jgi:hypothetical protein
MNDIYINIKPPTELGRIYYFHDPEVYETILYIKSAMRRYNIWSIDIKGGKAILQFDKHRLLKGVECEYYRSAWRKSLTLFVPEPVFYGDLEFVNIKSSQGDLIQPHYFYPKGFSPKQRKYCYQDDDTEVKILTDDSFSVAWILLGNLDRSGDWVGLSDRCSALIRDNKLLGFSVNLADAPLRKFQKPDSYQSAQ